MACVENNAFSRLYSDFAISFNDANFGVPPNDNVIRAIIGV